MADQDSISAAWPLSAEALQRWSRLTSGQRAFIRGYADKAIAAAETAIGLAASIDSTAWRQLEPKRKRPAQRARHLRLVSGVKEPSHG